MFGTLPAVGPPTVKIASGTNAGLLKKCAYASGAVVVSGGDPLSSAGDTVTIRYVGASVANIAPLSFVFRGKPGDTFNTNVTVKNTGPAGSLLY